MTELGEAFVPIRATLDKLDGDLADAKSKISGALDGLGKIGGAALGAGLAVATAAFGALGAGIGLALKEAMGAQEVMAQTEAVIRSTGGAAGMTAEEVADLATALSTQSRFSDDAIQSAENLLLTFTNIGEDTFPAATQAMVDMATAMGTDVSAGAIQLGKALNDPIDGIASLSRVGVQFTDEQKELIKSLVETGDVAGAQALILDELNRQFGGSAAAAADTFAGKLDVVKNQLLNVAEGVGMAVLPMLTDLFDDVITPAVPVVQAIADTFGVFFDRLEAGFSVGQALPALFSEIALALGLTQEQSALVGEKVQAVIGFFTDLIAKVQEVVAAVQPYIEMAMAWVSENVKLTDVLIALGVAIGVFIVSAIVPLIASLAPIILTFVAVIAVVALLRTAWEENWGGIQEKTAAVVAVLQQVIGTALAQIQAWWSEHGDQVLATVASLWATAQATFTTTLTAIQEFIGTTLATIQAWWAEHGEQVITTITTALTTIQTFVTGVLADIQAFWAEHGEAIITTVTQAWENIQTNTATAIEFIQTVIETALTAIQLFWDQWGETIMLVVSNAFESIGLWVDAFAALFTGDWEALGEALRGIWDNLWENIAAIVTTGIDNLLSIDWGGIGLAIIEGIANGLLGAHSILTNAAQSAAQAAFDAAKSFLGISSPSKLFAGVGENMMLGLAGGIKGNAGLAADAMISALATPVFNLDALVPALSLADQDAGPAQHVTWSSVTHVNTNRDPMRVLRSSRHLDKLVSQT